jgi:hypothetical protein
MEYLTDLWKIKLEKNTKDKHLCSSWKNPKYQYKSINTDKYNYGILTGERNDLLVVDIDYKDNGVEEFITNFDHTSLNTLVVKSPNNGYHLYFKYTSSSEECNELIKKYLTNKTCRN